MKKSLLKLLSVSAAGALATSAHGLTIIPTFDASILTHPSVVGITNAINAAIQVMQSNVVDNVTVNITFVSNEAVGLGQSQTYGEDFSYPAFLAALKSHATSARDTNALSQLPNTSTDPVIGGTLVHVTTAQARVLGLDTSYMGPDSTVSCKMSLVNFTRPPSDPSKYDLQQVLEHEMDEVLGISSGLPDTSKVWPVDLFRYTTNLVRTFTTSGDNAYFSTDGTNLIARYNMNSGGDYGDWWSYNYPSNWSPLTGVTSYAPQVQDAFTGPNIAIDIGVSELAALDVVGWTLATPAVSGLPPSLKIVRSGGNQYTLSWTNTASGYVLQERTNLLAGSWTFSSTGATNPAVLVTTTSPKFYRLYKSLPSGQSPAPAVTGVSAPHGPLTVTTRSIQPH